MRFAIGAVFLSAAAIGVWFPATTVAAKDGPTRARPALRPGVKAIFRVTELRNLESQRGDQVLNWYSLARIVPWECRVDEVSGLEDRDDVMRIECVRTGTPRWVQDPEGISESSPRVVDASTGRLLIPFTEGGQGPDVGHEIFPPPYATGYYTRTSKGLAKLASCPRDGPSLARLVSRPQELQPAVGRTFRKRIDPRTDAEGTRFAEYRKFKVGQDEIQGYCQGTQIGDCVPDDLVTCYSMSHGLLYLSHGEMQCGPPEAVRQELIAIEPVVSAGE